jgi:hypothetical protein
LSGNEDRSGPRGPGALRRYLTGGGRVRSVITLVVVGCAAALLLTAVTGAFATKNPDTKTNSRCTAGGCPAPNPFGYPLGADLSSVLALPSPPKTKEEVFYSHGTPEGATNVAPGGLGVVFGDGSDIFALTTTGGIASFPADLQQLTGIDKPAGMFLFRLRDANDKPIGFGVEQEMWPTNAAGEQQSGTFASDWIVSFPGRGVLWLNSNDSGGPDQTFTRPDGSEVRQSTTGPLKNGHGMIVGGSGEFAHRTGTWVEYDIHKPGYPALGTFEFEMHVFWDQKPKKK